MSQNISYLKWLWIVLMFTVSLFPSGSVYIANQTRKFICYAEQWSKVICYLLLSPKSIIRGRGPQIPMHANATFCPQKQFLHCIRPTHIEFVNTEIVLFHCVAAGVDSRVWNSFPEVRIRKETEIDLGEDTFIMWTSKTAWGNMISDNNNGNDSPKYLDESLALV